MVIITEELRAEAKKRLIVALDVPGKREAFNFIRLLQDKAGAYKIGMQLYNSEGPQLVEYIGLFGGQVFVDLKFHDIPNTVAEAAKVMDAGLIVFACPGGTHPGSYYQKVFAAGLAYGCDLLRRTNNPIQAAFLRHLG